MAKAPLYGFPKLVAPFLLIVAVISSCTSARRTEDYSNPSYTPTSHPGQMPIDRTTTTNPGGTIPAITVTPSSPSRNTPVATVDLITPAATIGPEVIHRSISPDGMWIAEDRWDQTTGRETFTIFNLDRSKSWAILDHPLKLGDAQPQLLSWSSDNRHFYYRYVSSAEAGEGKCKPFGIKGNLQMLRFDIDLGTTTAITMPIGSEHSISPDENKLAYIKDGEALVLMIRTIDTGVEQVVPIQMPSAMPEKDESAAGNIVWSPDGSQLVFSVASLDACDKPGWSLSSTILRLDIATCSISEIVRSTTELITVAQWPVEKSILVKSWNGPTWWVDSRTGAPSTAP